jgi:serine/threonine-protein kinase
MSPEQLQHDPLDRRSDVFCVGAILWELLVGRRLFAGESPAAIAYAMVMEPVPAPSTLRADVPSEVERVVLRALARDPAQRFASADEMAQALEDACRPATTRKVQEWLRSTVAASLEVRAKTVAEIEAWVVPEERPATREALESILLSTAPTPAITRTPSQVRAALGLPPIATDERGRIGSISGISNAESVVRTSSPELHTQLTSAEPLPSPASPERRASSRVGALLVVSVSAVLVLGAFTIMRGRVSSGADDPAHAASPPATATPSVESAGSTAPRASTPTALVIAEASASASAGATASAAPEVRPQSKPWSLPSFPLGPRPGAPTAAPTAPTKPASCENPFTIDANGRKRPRPECF